MILKRLRRRDIDFADKEAQEELAGHYVLDQDYQSMLDFCDQMTSGIKTPHIKDPAKFAVLKPLLLLARHYGGRRCELLATWNRGDKIVFKTHLLINRQLSEFGWSPDQAPVSVTIYSNLTSPLLRQPLMLFKKPNKPTKSKRPKNPLSLPKHDLIRSSSHFFCDPETCKQWINDVPKISAHTAQYRLKKMCKLLLESGKISRMYTWHDFRRSFCTDAYRFFDLALVKDSAGHSSTAVTDGYLREIRDFEENQPIGQSAGHKIRHWYAGKLTTGLPTGTQKSNLTYQNQKFMDLMEKLGPKKFEKMLSLLELVAQE